jgi:hypothetical protein
MNSCEQSQSGHEQNKSAKWQVLGKLAGNEKYWKI